MSEQDKEGEALRFEPSAPVYRISIGDDQELVIQEPLGRDELESKMKICIPNPWNETDEARFLPGIAYGKEGEFVMDIGKSFGSLAFHEEMGWVCTALVPKKGVVQGVIKEYMAALSNGSFTDRLLKRSKPKKKKG